MNSVPISVTLAEAPPPSTTLSYCHMFCPRTKERILSIPCGSDEMAIVVGRCQRQTVNIVEGHDFFAGYDQGEFLFRINDKLGLKHWLDCLGLHDKPMVNPKIKRRS